MPVRLSRRSILQTAGAVALTPSVAGAAEIPGPRLEGPNTPKICLEAGLGAPAGASPEEAAVAAGRRIRQLGVEHVISGGPRIPWDEARLKEMMDRLKANGVLVSALGKNVIRAATHLDVSREQCERAATVIRGLEAHP